MFPNNWPPRPLIRVQLKSLLRLLPNVRPLLDARGMDQRNLGIHRSRTFALSHALGLSYVHHAMYSRNMG